MRLAVKHNTVYRFDPPMHGIVQSLRLWPSQCESQTVLDWVVNIEGTIRGASFRDGAGDWIETAALRAPVSEIVVQVEGTVETTDLSGVLRGHRERVRPAVYMRPSHFTKPDHDIKELAKRATEGAGSELEKAHALSAAIGEAIRYTPGRTDPATTATEALAQGHGVCQDHAHAMISAAISQGIPARYVTGYLHADGDIAEASHAWAELYVAGLGWVGFDASNGVCPDQHYIRLGSGFDSVDAAPIRGVAQGRGVEALDVDVSVIEAAQ